MPFTNGDRVFIFNGELRGVRVKADGRIGAEKIFNYILRFDKGDLNQAVRLFEEGVDMEHLDDAMLDFGMPMGPLRLVDEVGLDVASHVAQTLETAFDTLGVSSAEREAIFCDNAVRTYGLPDLDGPGTT